MNEQLVRRDLLWNIYVTVVEPIGKKSPDAWFDVILVSSLRCIAFHLTVAPGLPGVVGVVMSFGHVLLAVNERKEFLL